MKKQNLKFQALRLDKFAKRIITNDIKPRVRIISDTNYSLDKVSAEVPVFYGPISQLPRIFKDEWAFSINGEYYYKEDASQRTISSLLLFFGLQVNQLMHIFIPGCQIVPLYGGIVLSPYSTSKEVGFNIIHLIQAHEFAMNLHILREINTYISKN